LLKQADGKLEARSRQQNPLMALLRRDQGQKAISLLTPLVVETLENQAG
jgi:hypothetical protein